MLVPELKTLFPYLLYTQREEGQRGIYSGEFSPFLVASHKNVYARYDVGVLKS